MAADAEPVPIEHPLFLDLPLDVIPFIVLPGLVFSCFLPRWVMSPFTWVVFGFAAIHEILKCSVSISKFTYYAKYLEQSNLARLWGCKHLHRFMTIAMFMWLSYVPLAFIIAEILRFFVIAVRTLCSAIIFYIPHSRLIATPISNSVRKNCLIIYLRTVIEIFTPVFLLVDGYYLVSDSRCLFLMIAYVVLQSLFDLVHNIYHGIVYRWIGQLIPAWFSGNSCLRALVNNTNLFAEWLCPLSCFEETDADQTYS
jgi:hypothetical protein